MFYFRDHLAKHGANWSSSETTPHVEGELGWEELADAARAGTLWDASSGLGGSQRGEVAWLKKCGIPFLRLDVGDGAPGSSESVTRLAARGEALCATLDTTSPG